MEAKSELVESMEVQGDLKTEVLLGRQVAEKAETLNEVSACRVSKDVVDASGSVPGSDPVPVLLGGVGGGVFVR